jgi:DnaJ-class molecular chaperone
MDYYQILEVNYQASIDDIKKAYRKLSKKYHPDVKGGDEETFKKLTQAYETLTDPDKKREYDNSLRQSENIFSESNFSHNEWYYETHDDFASMFNSMFDHANYNNDQSHSAGLDDDVYLHVTVSEAYFGLQTYVKNSQNENVIVNIDPCTQNKTIYKIPQSGTKRSVGFNPYRSNNRTIQGDLFVHICIDKEDKFSLKGHDVYTQIEIPWYDLLLGGKVQVQSFTGETLKFTIPENTKPYTKFRLKNKGYPFSKKVNLNNSQSGDLYCMVNVKYPEMTENQKDKINDIKEQIDKKLD